MKRRILCVLLSALILVSMVPAMSFSVFAVEDMKTSDKCIEILKGMEGFVQYPIADNGQWSIGYGCGCDPKDYPNGITEEEADELLRDYLVKFEKSVNSLAKRYNLKFTQQQFDALMLFTYNVGGNWVNSDGEFRQAVISGAKGNDFIYPFCLWSVSSGKLNTNLVLRRLIEADMYLNGNYTNKCPSHYTYVLYENNGGIGDVKVQGYDTKLAAMVKPVPTMSGMRFMGWYTAAEGGSWVTKLSAEHSKKTLYAHWQQGVGNTITGTPASYTRTSGQLGANSVYDAPGGKVAGSVAANATLEIVADYVDGSNVKWGKLKEGLWVNLGNALVGVVSSGSAIDPVEVTVTGRGVNVRTGPGVNYGIAGSVTKNDKITITETHLNGTELWGKFSKGWICMRYTSYGQSAGTDTPQPEEEAVAVSATGTVTTALRIRSGAGTNYPMIGGYLPGDKIQITQKKTAGGMEWGKTNLGWICLAYVKLDTAGTVPDQEEQKPETDTGTQTPPAQTGKVTGTVTTGLNIRAGAGTQNAIVGGYPVGSKVEILEQKKVNTVTWGRTDKGWISMAYVRLDTAAGTTGGNTSGGNTSGGNTSGGNTSGGNTGATSVSGVVTTKTGLLIRKGPGTNYASIGSYTYGAKLTVLEKKTNGGMPWGRTDKGWVCLNYVKLDGTLPESDAELPGQNQPAEQDKPTHQPTTGTGSNGTVISNTPLNIRSAPGTENPMVGKYDRGSRITILEQKTVGGVAWGKTDQGWVCMTYVQLDTAASTKYNATVTASSLCYRDKAGTDSNVLGYYVSGTKVQILETTYVNGQAWGKTDKGWICLAYVKK